LHATLTFCPEPRKIKVKIKKNMFTFNTVSVYKKYKSKWQYKLHHLEENHYQFKRANEKPFG